LPYNTRPIRSVATSDAPRLGGFASLLCSHVIGVLRGYARREGGNAN